MDTIVYDAGRLEPAYIALRHDIHAHPETAGCEERTATVVENELHACGIGTVRSGTCVIGTLQGGKPGKKLILRADMDALPVTEQTGLPFASRAAGVCHACGHDIHTAALLFAARLLSLRRSELHGSVCFLFQPAEETLTGAHAVLTDPVLSAALSGADAIFAAHTWPDLPAGSIGLRRGVMMASADTFTIRVQAQGGHAAHPERTADPVLTAAQIITQLHTIVSRELLPTDSAVLTVGEIHAGSAPNIIPSEAVLRGTFRTLSPAVRETIAASIRRITEQTAAAGRADAQAAFSPGCPPLINTDALLPLIERAAVETVGRENVSFLPSPSMGSEDFSCYLETLPGVFFRIGTGDEHKESRLGLHNARLVFNEASIRTGAMMLCRAAMLFTASADANI